jgi:hypothetical protein
MDRKAKEKLWFQNATPSQTFGRYQQTLKTS